MEKYFEEVCINLNSKFIILQKESIFTPAEEKGALKIYKEITINLNHIKFLSKVKKKY